METIIVQETDSAVRDVLTIALQEGNYTVFSVAEFQEDFMEMIEECRPHVVMLDFKIDGKKSIAICHTIKAVYPHLPVIAMSCNNNIHNVYDKFGFDAYITKPFDLDHLYMILRKYIPKLLEEG
ncbi:DNA-binding NtrC family response regulator [Pedobacter sp. UYP24]